MDTSPPYLGMYSMINGECLKLFEPQLLDEDGNDKVILPHVNDFWFDRRVVQGRLHFGAIGD